jgi:hypothetical protein
MRETLLLLLSLTAWHTDIAAQDPTARVSAPVLLSSTARGPLRFARLAEQTDTAVRGFEPTYWKEGATVGGAVGALGGALVGLSVCRLADRPDKNCTGSAMLGGFLAAVVLAIPGALIGGQIHKSEQDGSQ